MIDLSGCEMSEISEMYGDGKYSLTVFLSNNGHVIHQGEDPRKTLVMAMMHFGLPKRDISKKLSKRVIAALSLYHEISKKTLSHAIKINQTGEFLDINLDKGADHNVRIPTGVYFYSTPEWKRARYEALVKHGNSCLCCGRSPKDGVVIHVDHVKPKSIYPELALDVDNLQILCHECNEAKSNIDETDWR